MLGFLLVMSGWLAATLFATTLLVPLAVNALAIRGRTRRRFMGLHLVLGLSVPLVGLAHGALPISAAGIHGLGKPSLALGMSALVFLLVQALLGISLRTAKATRRRLRTAHMATMLTLAGLILVHILIIRAGAP